MILTAIASAAVNVLLLAGIPFGLFYAFHKRRHQRDFREIAERAGLQLGDARYIQYSLLLAFIVVIALVVFPPSLEASMREGSAFAAFAGLGLGVSSVGLSLLYGVLKTGFAEEFLFRGLIAGSLSRRFSLGWANVIQAFIFLVPHLLLLLIMPELWKILIAVFFGALVVGWIRIKSGSILGPWIVHAVTNVAMALSIAIRSVA